MDAHHLELADESFDCVFSMAVFEFLEYPQKALEEMFRVAKPGSPIIMGIINRDSDWGRLHTSREYTQKTVFKYAKLTTPDEIKKLKPQHLCTIQECLFIPPEVDEAVITPVLGKNRKEEKRGGFIWVLWRK